MAKKVIAVANQKGGVGKTTTATTLATGLTLSGKKTLLIDADPQSNSTKTYQADNTNRYTILNLFEGTPASNVIQKTPQGDIIPGHIEMSAADMKFTALGREFILKEAMAPIVNSYEYIVIDTPPSLGVIISNVFTFATSIVIPMFADEFSLQGIAQLSGTINQTKKFSNQTLVVDGILLTQFDGRTVLGRDIKLIIEEMAKILDTKVFDTTIRKSISLPESQRLHESILTYARYSNTSKDYKKFIKEYLGEDK